MWKRERNNREKKNCWIIEQHIYVWSCVRRLTARTTYTAYTLARLCTHTMMMRWRYTWSLPNTVAQLHMPPLNRWSINENRALSWHRQHNSIVRNRHTHSMIVWSLFFTARKISSFFPLCEFKLSIISQRRKEYTLKLCDHVIRLLFMLFIEKKNMEYLHNFVLMVWHRRAFFGIT